MHWHPADSPERKRSSEYFWKTRGFQGSFLIQSVLAHTLTSTCTVCSKASQILTASCFVLWLLTNKEMYLLALCFCDSARWSTLLCIYNYVCVTLLKQLKRAYWEAKGRLFLPWGTYWAYSRQRILETEESVTVTNKSLTLRKWHFTVKKR